MRGRHARQECDERRTKNKISLHFHRAQSVAKLVRPFGALPIWAFLGRDTLDSVKMQAVFEEPLVAFLSTQGVSHEPPKMFSFDPQPLRAFRNRSTALRAQWFLW